MIPTIVTIGVLAVSLLSGIIAVGGIFITLKREALAAAAIQAATQDKPTSLPGSPEESRSSERSQHRAKGL
jgi:hypothetical protein